MSERDELTNILKDELNTKFKKDLGRVAYILGADEENPVEIEEWISTGCTKLDIDISNMPNGGIPVGRIIEISGLEGSGKSLLCAHVIAETQRKGGVGVYIDTETGIFKEFFESVGVDIDNMVYVHMDTIEDAFEAAESVINKIRSSDKKKLVTIVVDSIAGASTKREMEEDFDQKGWATAKAIVMSQALRKITQLIASERIVFICTNQLRENIGVMFGDKWVTPGGKGLPFHSSVRLRLQKIGNLKSKIKETGKDETVGVKVRCKVMKNRVGPPFRESEFDIYFDRGIDDLKSWFYTLKDWKIIKAGGAWYSFSDKDKFTDKKFQESNWEEFISTDMELRKKVYEFICDTIIMKYKNKDSNIVEEILPE